MIDIYSSAIIFNRAYPNWDYSVRLNRTYVDYGQDQDSPDTSLPVNDISVTSPATSPYLQAYLKLGIYTLFDTVNSYIATSTVCKTTGNCMSADTVNGNFP